MDLPVQKESYFSICLNLFPGVRLFDEKVIFLHRQAQMAESVDALVSNTSGATRAGSTPALGTAKERVTLTLSFSFVSIS